MPQAGPVAVDSSDLDYQASSRTAYLRAISQEALGLKYMAGKRGLLKKQSSADLQSRLKSRKLLGVGATDDGLDIHRSKISQILGQHDSFVNASRIPAGLHTWLQLFSGLLTVCSLWSLLLPGHYSNLLFGGAYSVSPLYSTSVFCLALPLSATSRLYDRSLFLWTFCSLETFLIVHSFGAVLGRSYNSLLFIALLLLTNTWYLLTMMSDGLFSFVRKFTQSKDDLGYPSRPQSPSTEGPPTGVMEKKFA